MPRREKQGDQRDRHHNRGCAEDADVADPLPMPPDPLFIVRSVLTNRAGRFPCTRSFRFALRLRAAKKALPFRFRRFFRFVVLCSSLFRLVVLPVVHSHKKAVVHSRDLTRCRPGFLRCFCRWSLNRFAVRPHEQTVVGDKRLFPNDRIPGQSPPLLFCCDIFHHGVFHCDVFHCGVFHCDVFHCDVFHCVFQYVFRSDVISGLIRMLFHFCHEPLDRPGLSGNAEAEPFVL